MAIDEDLPSVAADEAPRRHPEPDTLAWSRMCWSRDPRTFVVASGDRRARRRGVAETLTCGVFLLVVYNELCARESVSLHTFTISWRRDAEESI